MDDLSQYIDFTFKIDLSGETPICILTDTSDYPEGASTFQGFVQITQPDGITISPDFSTPDITYGSLSSTKPYRLANDNTPQNGVYEIIYTVKCESYDDTVVTRTFMLSYNRPSLVITPLIDVFTPDLKVKDDTVYSNTGLAVELSLLNWSAKISNVGTSPQIVTGSANPFDLVFSGNYYDAQYQINLTNTIGYAVPSCEWVSLTDIVRGSLTFDVYSPIDIETLQHAIDSPSNDKCGCNNYTKEAQSLLYNMILNGNNGNTIGLQEIELSIEQILYPYKKKTHTGLAIPSYLFTQTVQYVTEWASFNW